MDIEIVDDGVWKDLFEHKARAAAGKSYANNAFMEVLRRSIINTI